MIGLVLLCKQVLESLSLYEISSPDVGYVRYVRGLRFSDGLTDS